ncbi:hypothetical protein LSAT2_001340 [Lamellibrachia satsuma]|nr:hypothetical protein LSAT2_001340 [Lamellibrachia satsuma]
MPVVIAEASRLLWGSVSGVREARPTLGRKERFKCWEVNVEWRLCWEIIQADPWQFVTRKIIRMKVAVFFAAICIFALVMPQAYAEEGDEPAVREARAAKAPVMCAAKCQYDSCKKICMHCAICYCSNGVYGQCKCCD